MILHTLKILLTIYVGSLILSWVIQYGFPTVDKQNQFEEIQNILVDGKRINHSYLHFRNPDNKESIVLIPDIFGGPDFLIPLALELKDSVNVLIPRYPEYSEDGTALSHSVEQRSKFISALIDSLQSGPVILLGHGYGGLIGMNMTSNPYDRKYEGLILLSSYGPQELQFLGNYFINRTLYSLLYPAVTVFKYAIPHMGWYYEQPVNYSFTHTLMALDQRSVRDQAEKISLPVLVLQPMEDRYITSSIAEELHRILPQSFILTRENDHQSIKNKPDIWSSQIEWFIRILNSDLAVERNFSDEERERLAREEFDAEKFTSIGGWTLFIILILLALSSLISEDLACIAGGLLVAGGIIDFWYAVLGCSIGVIGGDLSLYLLGRYVGNPVLRWPPFKWLIKPEDIVKAEQMFRMRGVEIIFATRFLPGTRFPIYLVSGLIQTRFPFFISYFMLSLAIWAPALVALSAFVGQPMLSYLESYKEYAIWLFPLVLILLYGIIKLIILLATVTGRRMLVVKFGRFRERFF